MRNYSMVAAAVVILATVHGGANAQPWQPVERNTRIERVIPVGELPPVPLQGDAAAKLAQSLDKARVNGKYRTLLRQIEMPADANQYGPFRDYGLFTGTEWKGIDDPPKGYWVYVQPYWYVWRDLAAEPRLTRNWGPEQVTGQPNTEEVGDVPTAWASRTQDGQPEWLMLEYDAPLEPTGIKIYESDNPGAVNRVTAFTLDGKEVEVWKGDDPTADVPGIGVLSLQFKAGFQTNRIKVYIDSPKVHGWNEIDAVGLLDAAGKPHWAVNCAASSTYAEQGETIPIVEDGIIPPRIPVVNPRITDDNTARIARLEAQVASLQAQVAELKQLLKAGQQPMDK